MMSWSKSPLKRSGCGRSCLIPTRANESGGARSGRRKSRGAISLTPNHSRGYPCAALCSPTKLHASVRGSHDGSCATFPGAACRHGHILRRGQLLSIFRGFMQLPEANRGPEIPACPAAVNLWLNIALEGEPRACFYQHMSTILIEVRRAKPSDATAVAATHDEAWRGAYQGVIPGPELDKLINRRGPQWWDSAIRKGSRIAVLAFGETIAGYANYGRNRARSLYYDGEIYE